MDIALVAQGLPGGTGIKNTPANAGDTGDVSSIPGSGRSLGIRNGNPLQYSCLKNPTDSGAWRVTVHGVHKESDMTERLSVCVCVYLCVCVYIHTYIHTHTHTHTHTHIYVI